MDKRERAPKISIIVPVYNVEPYLNKCLDSILNQSFTDFEVILVNDGSTDRSGSICDEYAKQDKRVVVVHQDYKGVSSARNVGVETAKGDYIGFIDSDDYIDKDMYSELYRLCQETESQIGVCKLGREIDGKLINKEQESIMLEMDNEEAMRQLFKGVLYRFSLCNKLFHKMCFDGVQFPEGRIHEDLSTTYRLFAHAEKVVFKNFIGYIYVKRSNSILTSTYNEKRLDSFIGWDEILSFIKKKYPQLYNDVLTTFAYWSTDNIYYILGQVGDSQKQMKYLNVIKMTLSNYSKEILKSKSLSLKYKYLSILVVYNTKLLIAAHSVKRIFLAKSVSF